MTAAQAKARSFRAKLKARLRDVSLSIEARTLWVLIESYANKDGTGARPSRRTLADLCGKRVAWVDKYLRELEAEGWLLTGKHETPNGWTNCYTVFYPDLIDRDALPPPERIPRKDELAPASELHSGSYVQWQAAKKAGGVATKNGATPDYEKRSYR